MPVTTELDGYLKQLRSKGQWFEDRLFAKFTIEAIAAWRKMADKAVVVFFREIVGGSAADSEVVQSLKGVPGWLRGDLTFRSS